MSPIEAIYPKLTLDSCKPGVPFISFLAQTVQIGLELDERQSEGKHTNAILLIFGGRTPEEKNSSLDILLSLCELDESQIENFGFHFDSKAGSPEGESVIGVILEGLDLLDPFKQLPFVTSAALSSDSRCTI